VNVQGNINGLSAHLRDTAVQRRVRRSDAARQLVMKLSLIATACFAVHVLVGAL